MAGDGTHVRQGLGQRHSVIGSSHRPGKAGAGRGQRRESELGEHASATQIPWVGHHEAASLVETAKRATAIGRLGHFGQSQPNVPAVNEPYTSPSIIDLIVVPQLRLYQMEACGSDIA